MKQSQPLQPNPAQSSQPLYARTRDAAAALAVSRNTILNWIRAGHLQAAKFGKTYRIPREAIERLAK